MTLDKILTILYTLVCFVVTVLVPFLTVFIKKAKALKAAKTEEEKAKVINEILGEAQKFVVDAEDMYKGYDQLVKEQGGESSGKLKKDKVMTNLQALCLQKGIGFDADFWSEQVEKIVTVTKKVNAKQKA